MSRLRRSPSRLRVPRAARLGFTFIEILTVIILVGLLAGLSAGRISAIITRQRVNRAAIALSQDLQAGFSLAQRDRKPITISFDSSSMQLSVKDQSSGTVFRKTSLSGYNMTSSNISMSRSSLNVYPAGLAADSLSITLSATINGTTYSQRVRMTRGGLVQIK